MATKRRSPSESKSYALATICWAGLLAGALDLAYAMAYTVYRGGSAVTVLRYISGGLLGPAAMKGGVGTAMLGFGLHFLVALGAAAVFHAASRSFPVLARRPFPAGFFYGIIVWVVMNLVVLRFSAWHVTVFPPINWFPVFFAHLVCVGLPIAWVVARRAHPDE